MRTLAVYRWRGSGVVHWARPIREYSEVLRTLCGSMEGRQGYELQVLWRGIVDCRRCKASFQESRSPDA